MVGGLNTLVPLLMLAMPAGSRNWSATCRHQVVVEAAALEAAAALVEAAAPVEAAAAVVAALNKPTPILQAAEAAAAVQALAPLAVVSRDKPRPQRHRS